MRMRKVSPERSELPCWLVLACTKCLYFWCLTQILTAQLHSQSETLHMESSGIASLRKARMGSKGMFQHHYRPPWNLGRMAKSRNVEYGTVSRQPHFGGDPREALLCETRVQVSPGPQRFGAAALSARGLEATVHGNLPGLFTIGLIPASPGLMERCLG